VQFAEHAEQQRDAGRHRRGGDQQPDQGFAAASQREPQA
jgi:hypothetical protein